MISHPSLRTGRSLELQLSSVWIIVFYSTNSVLVVFNFFSYLYLDEVCLLIMLSIVLFLIWHVPFGCCLNDAFSFPKSPVQYLLVIPVSLFSRIKQHQAWSHGSAFLCITMHMHFLILLTLSFQSHLWFILNREEGWLEDVPQLILLQEAW